MSVPVHYYFRFDYPGVYADVSAVQGWLDDTICELSDFCNEDGVIVLPPSQEAAAPSGEPSVLLSVPPEVEEEEAVIDLRILEGNEACVVSQQSCAAAASAGDDHPRPVCTPYR